MPSAVEKGTKTATIGTEHELLNVAEAGSFQFKVDTNKLVAGDVLELRVYTIVLTGGTPQVEWSDAYPGVQTDDVIKVSPWITNELTDAKSVQFTLKQTNGTGREFPWKVIKP